jgi:hypothetical protein
MSLDIGVYSQENWHNVKRKYFTRIEEENWKEIVASISPEI